MNREINYELHNLGFDQISVEQVDALTEFAKVVQGDPTFSTLIPVASALLGIALGAYINNYFQRKRDRERAEFEQRQHERLNCDKAMLEARDACLNYSLLADEFLSIIEAERALDFEYVLEESRYRRAEDRQKKINLEKELDDMHSRLEAQHAIAREKMGAVRSALRRLQMLCCMFITLENQAAKLFNNMEEYVFHMRPGHTDHNIFKNDQKHYQSIANENNEFKISIAQLFRGYIARPESLAPLPAAPKSPPSRPA